jgi:hypothetical protein
VGLGLLRWSSAIGSEHLIGHVHRVPLRIFQLATKAFELDKHETLKLSTVRRLESVTDQILVHKGKSIPAFQLRMVANPV